MTPGTNKIMCLIRSQDLSLVAKILCVLIFSPGLYSYAVLGQSKHAKLFSLMGQLSQPHKGNVYLLNQEGKRAYSSTIKGHQFIIEGRILEPNLYQIQIDTADRKYPVFLEASPIQMTIQENGKYQVEGSQLHAQWERYGNDIDQIREQLIGLYQQRSMAQQKGDTTLFNKLMKQNDSVSIQYGTFQREQIAQKPYSYFNLFLLKSAGMSDAYNSNMLDEFRPYLASYPTFQSIERELEKRAILNQKVVIGQKVYDFRLSDSNGVMHSLESLRKMNKIVLIDFWASWCGPCIKEIPNLKALHEQYASQGLAVVGISIDDSPEQWRKALSKHTPSGIQLIATDKSTLIDKYVIHGVPRTFLIDQDGTIQAHDLQGNDLAKKVMDLLSKAH